MTDMQQVAAIQMIRPGCGRQPAARRELIVTQRVWWLQLLLVARMFCVFSATRSGRCGAGRISGARDSAFLAEQAAQHGVLLVGGSIPTCA